MCCNHILLAKHDFESPPFYKNGQQIMLYFVGINAAGMFKYLTEQHCYKHSCCCRRYACFISKEACLSFTPIPSCFSFPLFKDIQNIVTTHPNLFCQSFSHLSICFSYLQFVVSPTGIYGILINTKYRNSIVTCEIKKI